MKFRKRPIVIEAMRFDGSRTSFAEILAWAGPDQGMMMDTLHRTVRIHTLEGPIYADVGDWIIRGVKGEFYPCKPDIFDLTYELADFTVSLG